MSGNLDESELSSALTKAIKETKNFISLLTEYQGGPVTTEYLVTSDIARELARQQFEVRVECMYRKLVNLVTRDCSAKKAKRFGATRADVVITRGDLVPMAIIEVKVRAQSVEALSSDLNRVVRLMRALKKPIAEKAIGAVVLQVHIPTRKSFTMANQYLGAAKRKEKRIANDLAAYARQHEDFLFTVLPLQDDNEGASGRDLEEDGREKAWGAGGHATRYHAIVIRKKVAIETSVR